MGVFVRKTGTWLGRIDGGNPHAPVFGDHFGLDENMKDKKLKKTGRGLQAPLEGVLLNKTK